MQTSASNKKNPQISEKVENVLTTTRDKFFKGVLDKADIEGQMGPETSWMCKDSGPFKKGRSEPPAYGFSTDSLRRRLMIGMEPIREGFDWVKGRPRDFDKKCEPIGHSPIP